MNTQSRFNGRVDTFVGTSDEITPAISEVRSKGIYTQTERFEGFRGKVNDFFGVFSSDNLKIRMSSAYWPISDVEFIIIRFVATLVGLAVGWAIPRNIIGGIALGALMYLIPGIILDRSIANRRKQFSIQLLDVLVLIKGAVLAGYSLPQALDLAVKEVDPPASEEFGRVLREIRFGFPMDQALLNLGSRMENDDLQLVVTAIVVNAQVGGNLSTVLESAIDTIRERIHLFGEIRSLTSYARYVGNVISLLPFITALIIFMLSPDYFDTLNTSIITQVIFILAFVGVILGNIVIRKIVQIKV
jgi:tight adherence protein B